MANKVNVNKNTIYNTLKSIFSIIYPLVVFPYVSRILQTNNIGKINYSNSIVSYFSIIASLGVAMYAIRECSKCKDDKKLLGETASEILSINIISTVIAYVALAILLIFAQPLSNYKALIIIQSTTIIFTTFGADWLNTAMEDFRFIAIRTIVLQFVSLGLTFIFIHKQEDYFIYAIISVVASSGANIINIIYRRKFCKTRFLFRNNWRKHLPPILKLFAMLCAGTILTSCDTTIIGLTLGDYYAGLYSAAIKIYHIAMQITSSITWVVVPQLSYAFSNDNVEDIKKLFRYSMNYSFVLGIPLTIGMVMLSKEIVVVAAGSGFESAALALQILGLAYFIMLFGNFFLNIYMLAAGNDKISMLACTIAALFNLVSNILLIPHFGIEAAAFTTGVSTLIIILICYPHRDKRIKLFPFVKTIFQPLVAGLGMLMVIVLVKLTTDNIYIRLFISIFVGGILYLAFLIILKNEFIIEMKEKVFKRIQ